MVVAVASDKQALVEMGPQSPSSEAQKPRQGIQNKPQAEGAGRARPIWSFME